MLFGITAIAFETRYSYTLYDYSDPSISNKAASCSSGIEGTPGVTGISGTQCLEKKNGTNWEPVPYCSRTRMSINATFDIINTKSDLDSGTYRVRTVFTVYCGQKTEDVEAISNEVTIK